MIPTAGARHAPDAPTAAPVRLRLSQVTKTSEGADQRVEALQPIDLEVREGEFLVLFGPSGCGKSSGSTAISAAAT